MWLIENTVIEIMVIENLVIENMFSIIEGLCSRKQHVISKTSTYREPLIQEILILPEIIFADSDELQMNIQTFFLTTFHGFGTKVTK